MHVATNRNVKFGVFGIYAVAVRLFDWGAELPRTARVRDSALSPVHTIESVFLERLPCHFLRSLDIPCILLTPLKEMMRTEPSQELTDWYKHQQPPPRDFLVFNLRNNIYSYPVGWGYRIHQLYLYRGVSPPPPPMSVLDMTLNNLMVRFQWCWGFGECGAPRHWHSSSSNQARRGSTW